MEDRPSRTARRHLAEVASVGLLFPAAIAVGFGVGWWLDSLLGTAPWMKVVCTAFGVAAAFLNLFRIALRDDDSSRRER